MKTRVALAAAVLGGLLFGIPITQARQQTQTAPQVYRPGPGIVNPVLIRQVRPKYTQEAMRARIQGVVQLEAVVLENGTIGDIRVIKSLDTVFGLDNEAIAAARQWLFRPGMKDGKPVPVIIVMELELRLNGNPPPAPPAPAPPQEMSDEEFRKGTYPETTTGLVKPKVLRDVKPKYTSEAMRAKIQGVAVIDVVVDVKGTVSRARIAKSIDSVHGLDAEALAAAKQWLFEPGRLDGKVVPVVVTMTLEFRVH